MATKKSWKLRYDAFVDQVRPDPKSVDEPITIIAGFIGKSNERGHVRVYFDETLTSFIDLKEADILYAEPLPEDSSPLGGSKLWVKAKAEYQFGDPGAKERPKMSFLQGDIIAAYQRQFELPTDAVEVQEYQYKTQVHLTCNPQICTQNTFFGKTCYGLTCIRTMCARSCHWFTCHPSCLRVSCGIHSCFNKTCLITCMPVSCFKTCHKTCFHKTPEITETIVTPMQQALDIDRPFGGTGFETFNPYRGF